MRTVRVINFVLVLAISFAGPGRAVETGASFVTTPPDGTTIPNWETGWTQPAGEPVGTFITGWDYVGKVNAASGTYLGNGWVLTAGHVGTGNFILNNETYAMVANSAQTIDSGNADLVLFQVQTTSLDSSTILNLPPLTLSMSDPVPFAYGTTGSSVAILGYGGGMGETWGLNTVTQVNELITPGGYPYVSNDFLTLTGVTTYNNPSGPGSQSINNPAQLVLGDSGGGDFIYNAAASQWELAGINEVTGTTDQGQNLSGFVQLDTYSAEITTKTVPEPSAWLLLGLGMISLFAIRRTPCDGAACSGAL